MYKNTIPKEDLLNGRQLIQLSKADKNVKSCRSNHKIRDIDIQLADLSLNHHGDQEDYIYADNEMLH